MGRQPSGATSTGRNMEVGGEKQMALCRDNRGLGHWRSGRWSVECLASDSLYCSRIRYTTNASEGINNTKHNKDQKNKERFGFGSDYFRAFVADTAGLPDCLSANALSHHHNPVLQVQRIDPMELKLFLPLIPSTLLFHAGPSGKREPERRRAGRDLKVGLINV